ncbi:MAG TPA: DUF4145 domain-containing protein [Planctomycetaceae bacterium]|jgi:hypothetical protein|nr:DUF4145 domain-containing protein [Planctomycetaceae bacterium]
MTNKDRIGRTEQVNCAVCKHETEHTIRDSYNTRWNDDEMQMDGGVTHEFLVCGGCKSGTYRTKHWSNQEPDTYERFYPPRHRDEEPPTHKLREFNCFGCSDPIHESYCEVIEAINHDMPTLAAAGVRIVIERISKEQGIADGPLFKTDGTPRTDRAKKPLRGDNLEGRINGLAEHGQISRQQAAALHEIRFLGNDAVHEMGHIAMNDVIQAVGIVEHIMAQVYEQPAKAMALASRKRTGK